MNSTGQAISNVLAKVLVMGDSVSLREIYARVEAGLPLDHEDWRPYGGGPTWQHHVRSWLWSRKRSGRVWQPRLGEYQLADSRPTTASTVRVYRRAVAVASRKSELPFSRDPNLVDRALAAHVRLQNALHDLVESWGAVAWSPSGAEPDFDLAWEFGNRAWVSEVKSLSPSNEDRQLRLGLGQVLDYQHEMSSTWPEISAVLAVERAPREARWTALCDRHGVALVWPDIFRTALLLWDESTLVEALPT